jgi:hypothetical protein
MFRIFILSVLLILGGQSMAKDGTVQAPKNQTDTGEWEQFMNSDEGQDITRLFEEFSSGKKSFDEVADEYQKKWANKPAAPTVRQAPTAPFVPVR